MIEPRKRLSASETKARLVSEGLDMFDAEGMAPTFDAITLERAVRRADVSRSSAYNVWSEDSEGRSPQDAFRAEVVRVLIDEATAESASDAFTSAAIGAFELGLSGAELKRELVRRGANAHLASLEDRRSLRILNALMATVASMPADDLDRDLVDRLRASQEDWRRRLIDGAFRPFGEVLGLLPRPEFDPELVWDQFAFALMCLGDGLFNREPITDESLRLDVISDETGSGESWTLFGVAIEALVDRFFMFAAD